MKKVAIIGAGPAGLTAAYTLSKSLGIKIEKLCVYEAASVAGGLSKSLSLWNQKVDLGPHRFFSHDTRVNQFWLEIVNDQYEMVSRLTRIYYKNRFYHYPLKAFNALSNLGYIEAIRCIFSYLGQKFVKKSHVDSFESWVSRQFGKRLFRHFFKAYTEKLWGISCADLDVDFAAQRIKKLSLAAAIINSLSFGNKKKHKTLVDEFAYPFNGTGWVYEEMARMTESNGAKVAFNTEVKRVIVKNGAVSGLELADGSLEEFDIIISTMPLSLMALQLENVPSEIVANIQKLRYRNTIMVYLNVNSENLFPDQWIYVHDSSLKTGRICNFRNWVPGLYNQQPTSILAMEFWCFDNDDLWSESDDTLIELASKEIGITGLLGNAAILDGHIERISGSYPVYFKGYKSILKPIESYLDEISGLIPIGRYGAYKYNNQDHSILMGLLAAENILQMKGNNLWKINTDYESYQEQSLITKTGLKQVK